MDSYGCGEDNTTCPNETTCCTGTQSCCPVGNTYKCCPVENVSKHILPPLSVTESKYSNVVPLSASAPWSNRGRGEAELDQPIPNHNYTINSHFSGNLLSRLGGGAKVLFRLAAMCPQRQPGTLYGENKTCKCHLLRRSRLYVKLSSQRCWSIALVVMAPEKSQF